MPVCVFFKDARLIFKKDELGVDILRIAIPAALALMADPIASLIDTAFIGHIGPVELAGVGVAIAVFNQVSRIAIFPLVSITTSFVAEEDAVSRMNTEGKLEADNMEKACLENSEVKELITKADAGNTANKYDNYKTPKLENEKRHVPSASSALVIGGILGLVQAVFLIFGAKLLLGIMGIKHGSPMLAPAQRYLILRSLGAPAILLSLAMQGIFRGFKDTTTPLYATVAGDVTNIILDPIFIFTLKLGVSGAAIAHIISHCRYLLAAILLWKLMEKIDLLPPNIGELQFSRFLKNGVLLLARVIAATFCVTLAASMAARHGPTTMAAFQICLQIWLASSLLADGLAVAGQAILATAFAEKDLEKSTSTASRVLQLGLVLGLILSVFLGVGLHFGSRLFTNDRNVLRLISIATPFVAATQPINALAFVFDGVNFGASDFIYSAYSMVLVAIVSIVCLFLLSASHGFVGIWIALTIYMSLRMFAGFWRIATGSGPWNFLRS
ncbi:protein DETOXIFICATION 42-like isoform X3 [Papaver somniferum]|nr:protein DETOXIFICATION 42-like isoform X3 [Papaver somniferum]XP_026425454.1 protein DETOXIFICATION 42-like isoform X3 [Papaver somniferum]